MGSVLSRGTQQAASKAREASRSAAEAVKGGRQHETIRIPTEREAGAGHRRQTRDEWAQMLKQVSGVISSSTWDGASANGAGSTKEMDKDSTDPVDRHPAQRSAHVNEKLPSRPRPHPDVRADARKNIARSQEEKEGRLAHKDIVELFHLRRRDPEKWSSDRIAERFGIPPDDARHLLAFTRTYLARSDPDGVIRAYYNPHPRKTIARFEAD